MSRKEEAEELIHSADKLLELREFEKAKKLFEEASELAPGNPVVWFGLAKALSENLYEATEESDREYSKALKLADDEQKTLFRNQYAAAKDKQQKLIEEKNKRRLEEKVQNYRGARSGGNKYLIFSAIFYAINVLAAAVLIVLPMIDKSRWFGCFLIIIVQVVLSVIVAFVVASAERQMPYYLPKRRRLTYIIIITGCLVLLALVFVSMYTY